MMVARLPRLGHAARKIAAPLAALFVWDVLVTVVALKVMPTTRPLELPLALFGSAIALFLGFAVNAAYARWWEARGLWGQMINASRSLAREALTLCDESAPGARPGLPREIVQAQIALANVLRTGLRGEPIAAEAGRYLPADAAAALEGTANKPNMILTGIARLMGEAHRTGMLDSFGRVRMETTLVDVTSAQGGMERIKNTPLPSQYRFYPFVFVHVFCVLLPFAVVQDLGWYTPLGSALVGLMFLMAVEIGIDLMDPFANDIYDVPMTALCRTIEIDLLQMVGEPAPKRIEPVDGVLW